MSNGINSIHGLPTPQRNIPLPYMKEIVFKSLLKQNNGINTVASDTTREYFHSDTSTEENKKTIFAVFWN